MNAGKKLLQSCLICFWMKKPNFYFMRQYVRATFSSTVNLTRKHTAADISSQDGVLQTRKEDRQAEGLE